MKTIVNLAVRENLHLFLEHFGNLTPEDRYCRFFHTMGPDAIRSWLLDMTEVPFSHFLIVEEAGDGSFTGVAQLAKEDDIGEIAISVVPNCRGKGIAYRLVSAAISTARVLGLKKVYFKCEMGNRACRNLYSSLGFVSEYNQTEECIEGYLNLEG